MAIAVLATRNALVATYIAQGAWISVHTVDPGTTGANEATGGTPAYARQQTTWGPVANSTSTGAVVAIDAPAGTYLYAGIWTLAVGGTFVDKILIKPTTLAGQGQLIITPTYTQT